MTFLEVISWFGGGAGLLAALYFLVKKLVSHFLDKDIENHKSKLEEISHVFKTKFSGLHEKREICIAEVYKQIVLVHRNINRIETFNTPKEEQTQTTLEAKNKYRRDATVGLFALVEYIGTHKLYFPKDVFEPLDKLSILIMERLAWAGHECTTTTPEVTDKKLAELNDKFDTSLKAMEDMFRKLLEA